jgi:hypothetical protein
MDARNFRSLPPGGSAPSRATVGSRNDSRRRGAEVERVGDEAAFRDKPPASREVPRGRRPDPRDEYDESRRFASARIPQQRLRGMADMTTTDEDEAQERRRRRDQKFDQVRTRPPPDERSYDARPVVLHHGEEQDDRNRRYATAGRDEGSRRRHDAPAEWSTSTPLRPLTRERSPDPSNSLRSSRREPVRASRETEASETSARPGRGREASPADRRQDGARVEADWNTTTPMRPQLAPLKVKKSNPGSPFASVDSELYGTVETPRRSAANVLAHGRHERYTDDDTSAGEEMRGWRETESLPSSPEATSPRRREVSTAGRQPREEKLPHTDAAPEARNPGPGGSRAEPTATAAGRRRRRLPGDLPTRETDRETTSRGRVGSEADTRRRRSDSEDEHHQREADAKRAGRDPDATLAQVGEDEDENRESDVEDYSDSETGVARRRRAAKAPLFVENARTGKFTRLGYKAAQKEQERRERQRRARDEVEELPKTVEQTIAGAMKGLHACTFFLAGLLAGMALLHAVLM